MYLLWFYNINIDILFELHLTILILTYTYDNNNNCDCDNVFIYFFSCLTEKNTMTYKDTDEYLTIFLRPTHFYAQSAYDLVSKPTTDSLLLPTYPYRCPSSPCVENVTVIFPDRRSDPISLFTSSAEWFSRPTGTKCQHIESIIIMT